MTRGKAEAETPSPADQEEIATFLSDPQIHGPEVSEVERIDTHASLIFLAGDRAYKVKRAIRYPYLDYGTLEQRRLSCIKEVALNRRTAPELYLGVTAVTRTPKGGLKLGGDGEAVEWVIAMRRFGQDCLFDSLARSDRLTPKLMSALADEVAVFHSRAERLPDQDEADRRFGGAGGPLRALEETLEELTEDEVLFPAEDLAMLSKTARQALGMIAPLLEERLDQGFVRRCHGDLHLRNIFLSKGQPRLFDGIEFNDDLSCIDTLYDLAFLLMDLEHRDLRPLANLILNRYFRSGEGLTGLATLPSFLALRALVRAKVNASAAKLEISEAEQGEAGDPRDLARRARAAEAAKAFGKEASGYFRKASEFLNPPPPCLIAIGGLSGSGKSSLALLLAPRLGPSPGALILRSDVVRKTLFGVEDAERLPKKAYRPEVSRKVYEVLRSRARTALAAGHSVVVDALQNHPRDREAIEAVAHDPDLVGQGSLQPRFFGFWLDAPREVLEARIMQRQQAAEADASDADVKILAKQLQEDPGSPDWIRLDASRGLASLTDEAAEAIGLGKV